MKKFFSFLITATLLLSLGTLSACEDDDPSSDNTPQWGNANNGGGSQSPNIEQIISQNVSVSSYYSNYAYHISLSTHLQTALPGKSISYGILFQYTQDCPGYYFTSRFTQNQDYGPVRVAINASKTQYDLICCIFVDADHSPYIDESFYWSSYLTLEEKMANGESLSNSERDLYNEVVKYMNEAENKVKRQLIAELFVEIDGKAYALKRL